MGNEDHKTEADLALAATHKKNEEEIQHTDTKRREHYETRKCEKRSENEKRNENARSFGIIP
jgi:hypothetical protein